MSGREQLGRAQGPGAPPAAVLSTDAELRKGLRRMLASPEIALDLILEIDVPFTEVDNAHLEQLREREPEIIFLDLASNPHVGLKLAEYLADAPGSHSLVAIGPTESPELLLEAMQAGVSEYLPKPVEAGALREALERLWRKTGRVQEDRRRTPGTVVPVFSAKGGAGSTTVATNLAIEIQRLSRKKTLLIDLDLELGETALLLGMEPKFSVVDLIRNFHRVDAGLLASYIQTHESGLDLLSAPFEPVDYESVSGERVGQVLDFLRKHYDYLVVDSPKTLNPATLTAMADAEALYLVITADLPSLRNVTRCMPLLRSVAPRQADRWLRPVLNRYDPGDVIDPAEIEKTLHVEVFHTVRNDYRSVMRSINEGEPAVFQSKSAFAADIRDLAATVTGVPVEEESGGGFLSGLFSRKNGRGRSGESAKPPTRRSRTGRKVTEDE